MEKSERERRLNQLGARLTEIRTARDLSMERLAFMAGLSKEGVRRIERGEKDPRYTTLFQLAEALNMRVRELVDVPIKESPTRKKSLRKFNKPEVEL